MDLLATVRKEGTRGGTGDFKWSDIQSSSHREHYLGHSLMAPVGRWQKNRDLNWYAKGDSKEADGEDPEQRSARERKEEIRRVKEAEEDALARALGLPVPDRSNANLEALGNRKEIDRVLRDAVGKGDGDLERGIGFGTSGDADQGRRVIEERIEGNAEPQDREMQHALKEYKRRHGDQDTRHKARKRSRDRNRDRERRRHRDSSRDKERHRRESSRNREGHRSHHHRHSARERDSYSERHSRPRSMSRDHQHRDRKHNDYDRSRSPRRRGGDPDRRRQRD